MSLPNIWHSRLVAPTAAKACLVCCKPSSTVLITPDNKDFFYICPVHLKDRNFCSPIVDSEKEEAKKKDEAMAREIEKVKKEYEEKQRKKNKEKEKEKGNEKGEEKKGTEKEKEKEKKTDDNDGRKEEEDNDVKKKAANNVSAKADSDADKIKASESKSDDTPRVFALHKNFYQMRIDRQRNMELARRNRDRLRDPSFFPSVPNKAP